MNKNNIIAVVVVLAVLVAGGVYLNRMSGSSQAPSSAKSETGQTAGQNVITYTDSGFSPASLMVKVGDTVMFKDESAKGMWVATGAHPDHLLYDSTNRETHCAAGYSGPAPFDQCARGSSYSFTFDKAGTWKFHNHVSPTDFGSIIAQ